MAKVRCSGACSDRAKLISVKKVGVGMKKGRIATRKKPGALLKLSSGERKLVRVR